MLNNSCASGSGLIDITLGGYRFGEGLHYGHPFWVELIALEISYLLRKDNRLIDLSEKIIEHLVIEGKQYLVEKLLGHDPIKGT